MRILKTLFKGLLALLVVGYIGLIAWAYWPTGIEEVPARQLAGPQDRFVDVSGLELRYQTWGKPGPDRPNLVLIHGFGNSLQSFRLLGPLLAEDYHVIAVDLPGFGLSAKPTDYEYSNAQQAATIGDFIRALGLEQAIIGGHSLGGAIAVHVAINEPEITGAVLFNPGIINTGVPPIAKYYFFPLQRLTAKTFNEREFRTQFLKRSFIDPGIVTDEVIDNLMLAMRSEGFLAGSTVMMGQYNDPVEASMLPDMPVHTLIVWGEEDRNKSPEELAALLEGLPDDAVVSIAGAGHYVHEEAPAASAEGIIADKQALAGG